MFTRRFLIAIAAGVMCATGAAAQDKSILVASTTSTQDSGLFGHLLPPFNLDNDQLCAAYLPV